jgi:hypothetical protein
MQCVNMAVESLAKEFKFRTQSSFRTEDQDVLAFYYCNTVNRRRRFGLGGTALG